MGTWHGNNEFASNAKGNTAVTLASVALGLGALGGFNGNGWLGGGLFGGGNQTAFLAAQAAQASNAAKDAQIAKLESERYADRNTLDLYKYVDGKFEQITNQLAALTFQTNANTTTLGQITKIGVPNTALIPGVPAVTITNTPTTSTAT